MRAGSVLALALVATSPAHGAPATDDLVLTALQRQLFPTVSDVIEERVSSAVTDLLTTRVIRYERCGEVIDCRIAAARWSEPEVEKLAVLAKTAGSSQDAVRRELAGLNQVIGVYAQAAAPLYPQIDGPGPLTREQSSKAVATAIAVADLLRAGHPTSADPGVSLALALLDGADRLDAIRFGPLAQAENAAALAHARSIDWSRFRYSAIIVPGIGSDDAGTPLSGGGKLNVHLAAIRYRAGLAPFIIVSGGAVHPRNTRFIEAVEMRRALLERYDLPPAAILIDPYARHTTTNLRNAGRLLTLLRPPAMPALVVTNAEQAAYIAGPVFAERNQRELGYQPWEIGKRPFGNEVELHPNNSAFPIDPNDPLDP